MVSNIVPWNSFQDCRSLTSCRVLIVRNPVGFREKLAPVIYLLDYGIGDMPYVSTLVWFGRGYVLDGIDSAIFGLNMGIEWNWERNGLGTSNYTRRNMM